MNGGSILWGSIRTISWFEQVHDQLEHVDSALKVVVDHLVGVDRRCCTALGVSCSLHRIWIPTSLFSLERIFHSTRVCIGFLWWDVIFKFSIRAPAL